MKFSNIKLPVVLGVLFYGFNGFGFTLVACPAIEGFTSSIHAQKCCYTKQVACPVNQEISFSCGGNSGSGNTGEVKYCCKSSFSCSAPKVIITMSSNTCTELGGTVNQANPEQCCYECRSPNSWIASSATACGSGNVFNPATGKCCRRPVTCTAPAVQITNPSYCKDLIGTANSINADQCCYTCPSPKSWQDSASATACGSGNIFNSATNKCCKPVVVPGGSVGTTTTDSVGVNPVNPAVGGVPTVAPGRR